MNNTNRKIRNGLTKIKNFNNDFIKKNQAAKMKSRDRTK